jgi:hypothetical protein
MGLAEDAHIAIDHVIHGGGWAARKSRLSHQRRR